MGIGDMIQAQIDEQDGKRYRWLRDHGGEDFPSPPYIVGHDHTSKTSGEALDRFIDAKLSPITGEKQ